MAKQRQTLLKQIKAGNYSQVSGNACFPTNMALEREERVSDYLDPASQGRFPVCAPHPLARKQKEAPRGSTCKDGWSSQDSEPGFLPGCLCAQPKTLSTTRPSVAPGSLGPQSQISPAINKGKEAVCPPTLQNKAVRAGYRQPPPCQAQTHKV